MTLYELKNGTIFPIGGENVNFAQYFVGTSYLRQHRTKIVREMRSQIFRQIA